jgi:filamentous hemagglutinin
LKKLFKKVKRFFKKYGRAIIAVVAAVFTAGAAYAAYMGMAISAAGGAMAITGAQFAAASLTASIVSGAAAGFVAGGIMTGTIKGALTGAIAGGIAGGISGYFGNTWNMKRVAAQSVGNGISSKINGGKFKDGFRFSLAVSMMSYASHAMRAKMIAQSKMNPDNATGKSVGFHGDGFKLGGGRYNPSFGLNQRPSPLGGIQGDVGQIFGMQYQPGSWQDYLVEAYAGPHDYLNSGFWYDSMGNIKTSMSMLERGFGEALNYVNVITATPFVAASVTPSYLYPQIGQQFDD